METPLPDSTAVVDAINAVGAQVASMQEIGYAILVLLIFALGVFLAYVVISLVAKGWIR